MAAGRLDFFRLRIVVVEDHNDVNNEREKREGEQLRDTGFLAMLLSLALSTYVKRKVNPKTMRWKFVQSKPISRRRKDGQGAIGWYE